jgi:hypothetical protein
MFLAVGVRDTSHTPNSAPKDVDYSARKIDPIIMHNTFEVGVKFTIPVFDALRNTGCRID